MHLLATPEVLFDFERIIDKKWPEAIVQPVIDSPQTFLHKKEVQRNNKEIACMNFKYFYIKI